MKYVAKQIPEGINTSPEHPLKELFLLLSGAGVLLVIVFLILMLLSDLLVRYIPEQTERQWFSESRLSFLQQESSLDTAIAVDHDLARLVKQLNPPESDPARYSIRLIESDTPNAFITPGGHIFVTTELLHLVHSENALSMVIAHEMAHQIHRHPIRSMGRGVVIAVALMIFTGIDGSEWVTEVLANSINLGLLAYSRDQEREADRTGLQLLTAYYGHASGSSDFFSHMKQQQSVSQSGLSEYFSTHPNTDQRLLLLQQHEAKEPAELTPLPDSIRHFIDSVTQLKSDAPLNLKKKLVKQAYTIK
jgi:predicted Zn-dependent protease